MLAGEAAGQLEGPQAFLGKRNRWSRRLDRAETALAGAGATLIARLVASRTLIGEPVSRSVERVPETQPSVGPPPSISPSRIVHACAVGDLVITDPAVQVEHAMII